MPAVRRHGPRIAVIGNCQARGIARSVEMLAPESRVTLLPVARLRREHASVDALADVLGGFDHVFTQGVPPGFLPPGDAGPFEALPHRVVYPTIVFAAFHPDMIYVGDASRSPEATLVPSPLGLYHSAIALFAYRCGLDEGAAVALFREEVFATLGYLDGWEGAAGEVLRAAGEIAFGLDAAFLRWSRRGTFMHVINHPKLPVLGDIARLLLERSGVGANAVVPEDYLPDELARDVVWPVYPAIAERYAVPGSYLFKAKASGGERATLYDLPAFVAASFAVYRRMPPDRLSNPRLEAWERDARVRGLFGLPAL